MVELKEMNTVTPLCPYCSDSVSEVWYRKLTGLLGSRYVYFCSSCHKVLGVSHRKGFWMG